MKPHIEALINVITTKIFELSLNKPKQADIDCLTHWVEILKAQEVETDVVAQLGEWVNSLQKLLEAKPKDKRPLGSQSF